jgi:hypothetical protein
VSYRCLDVEMHADQWDTWGQKPLMLYHQNRWHSRMMWMDEDLKSAGMNANMSVIGDKSNRRSGFEDPWVGI